MLMPWPLIVASCIGMFAATASGSIRSPFLLDMAQDLNVTLPAIANLFGVTSVSWGLAAYIAGAASDRVGRRIFLVGAPAGLACAVALAGLAQSYWSLTATVIFAGCMCGALTAAAMTEVSLRTEDHQRGRALGWVMSGQSLTLLIGIPLAAWLVCISRMARCPLLSERTCCRFWRLFVRYDPQQGCSGTRSDHDETSPDESA